MVRIFLARGRKRFKNRCRVVGEIIYDRHPTNDGAHLHPPLHAFELRQSFCNQIAVKSEGFGCRDDAQAVADVEHARERSAIAAVLATFSRDCERGHLAREIDL